MIDICWVETEKLRPNGRNARTHSRKQIRQIADSITGTRAWLEWPCRRARTSTSKVVPICGGLAAREERKHVGSRRLRRGAQPSSTGMTLRLSIVDFRSSKGTVPLVGKRVDPAAAEARLPSSRRCGAGKSDVDIGRRPQNPALWRGTRRVNGMLHALGSTDKMMPATLGAAAANINESYI